MSDAAPSGAGAMTMAAAPSPKIMREVRTVPILSENFSAHTSSTGRSISCSKPYRLGNAVWHARAGGDDVARSCASAAAPARRRARSQPMESALCWCNCRTGQRRSPPASVPTSAAPSLPPAATFPPAATRCSSAASIPVLLGDLRRASCATSSKRDCGSGRHCCR